MADGPRRQGNGDLQDLVDDLADELGRSVVVDDPVVRMLCTSRHFGDEDEVRIRAVLQRDAGPEVSRYVLEQGVARWQGAGIVPARADLGLRARLCVPLRERGELLGLLMVIDADATLTPAQIARIEEVSRTAAALLHRDKIAADGDQAQRERAVLGLLGDDAGERRRALAAGTAAGWMTDAAKVCVTVIDVSLDGKPLAEVDLALRSVVESASRRHPRRVLTAVRGGRATCVHASAVLDHTELAAQADRMVVAVGRLLDQDRGVVAGIGSVVAGLEAAWRSFGQALAAARGARMLRGCGPVANWDALGAYGVLLQLPASALTPELVPQAVERLLRDEKAPRLVETLRTFLDHGGSIPRTAEALHLHRTSLYYRLDQIEAVTGLDLDDGRNRLLLHLGLLVADLVPTPGLTRRGTPPRRH
jgi:sugar diacid utilization regulator